MPSASCKSSENLLVAWLCPGRRGMGEQWHSSDRPVGSANLSPKWKVGVSNDNECSNLKLFAKTECQRHILLRAAMERFRYPARDVGRVIEVRQERSRMATFRSQIVADEALPGTCGDVVQKAEPVGGDSTSAGRLHWPLECRVDEIWKTSTSGVTVITWVLRTPGKTRTVDRRDRVQQRRRADAVSIFVSGHVTVAAAP